jgi:hypothetical protein
MQVPRLLGYFAGALLDVTQLLRPTPRYLIREAPTLGGLPCLFVLPAMLLTTIAEELTRATTVLLLSPEHLRLLPPPFGRLALSLGISRICSPAGFKRT